MIKEILVLILLYQHSNAAVSSEDEFTLACQQIFKGDFIADGKICIPSVSKDMMQWWPSNRPDKRPEIWISISNFQVIGIGTQTLTLSMYMDITWFDNRPILESSIIGSKMIFLSMDDKKKIWSPNIIIPSNMISKNVEDEEFGLTNLFILLQN